MSTKPPDFADDLPELDMGSLPAIFPELAGHENDAARGWVGDRRHLRRADKAVLLDGRRLADALEHIGRLPAEGESFHLVTRGRYSLWHVVKAVLHLGALATIDRLTVATLGFSRANLEEMLQLLDSGRIGKVDFLFSVYFRSNERELCQRLAHELAIRGQRVVAMLTHAKVVLMELSDGRAFTVESSANLRSCSSIEQITMTHDAELTAFHRRWIVETLEAKK